MVGAWVRTVRSPRSQAARGKAARSGVPGVRSWWAGLWRRRSKMSVPGWVGRVGRGGVVAGGGGLGCGGGAGHDGAAAAVGAQVAFVGQAAVGLGDHAAGDGQVGGQGAGGGQA
ncbi:hypothetical protein GCM10026982_08540 [Nocardiopsis aegyptia]